MVNKMKSVLGAVGVALVCGGLSAAEPGNVPVFSCDRAAAQLPREYPWGTCDVQSNVLTLTVSPTWNRRTVEIAGLRTAVRNVDEWYDIRHGDIVSVRLLKETHGQPRVITVTLADAPAYDPKPVMANGLLFLDAANAARKEKGRLVWKARFPESGRFNVSLRRPSPAGAKVSLAIDGVAFAPGEVVVARPGEKEIVLESSVPSPSLGLCFDEYELAEAKVSVDFRKAAGPMKPLHGVNNAPRRVPAGSRQHELKAAGIPYSRLHDTAGMFGGTHYVDIPNVFPNFDADENDPKNYDFAFTDAFLKPIVEAGCQPFYRLGVTIENFWRVKDYHIAPPKDFAKWARICEHVVRHYNEGWANGFRWNIVYWEIWNEPENPAMWKGTRAQFYELYRVAANHLKRRFPRLKVGGYGSCGFYSVDDPAMRTDRLFSTFVPWFEDFLAYVKDPKTAAPLDFYSWHLYVAGDWSVERIATHADYVRRTLDAAGFAKTESIFNEWNIFEGWAHGGFDAIKEPPIAARVAAAFALMQAGTIDKAMYYDAQPNGHYCGLFYYPSERTTPVYEAFRAFNMLYTLGTAVESAAPDRGLAVVAAKGGSDKAILLANVANDSVKIRPAVAGAEGAVFRLYRVDPQHRGLDEDGTWKPGEELTVPKDGFVLLSTRDAKVVQTQGNALEHALNGIDTSASEPEQTPAATDAKDGNGPKESGTTFVRDALRKYVDSGELPGMISVLYKDGVQETCCIGYADVEAKRPMTMDSIYMQCSQTKGFCGVTVAKLVEEGRLSLDDPVSKYLPEFAELWIETSKTNGVRTLVKAKNALTVRMCLNHMGGFPFETSAKRRDIPGGGWSGGAPLRSNAAVAAASPIMFEPGTKTAYSNTGIDIGAAVVEVVAGMKWEDYLQQAVLDPLGMTNTTFWPTDEQLKGQVELYECVSNAPAKHLVQDGWQQRPYNDRHVVASAGAGLWTTANDQLKFYKMLMNLGLGENGVRVLKEETVKSLLAITTRPKGMGGYSLGLTAPEEDTEFARFGHGGAWGTGCTVSWRRKELTLWAVQLKGGPRPWDDAFYKAGEKFFQSKFDNSDIKAYTGRVKE